jgi:5-methylcytosine-specific restriction endonuclease McrA
MTEEQRQKLYDEGYCDKDIAVRLGVAQPTITNWRKKRGFSLVFENRKRLTDWETKQVQDYLAFVRKFTHVKSQKTLGKYEKGLTAFIMTLKHQLSQVSQNDVEEYIISHNSVDLTKREELLRTDLARQYKIPDLPVSRLYSFASRIIATRIFYRDHGCTLCKSINPLHMHHIKGKYNLLDENLTTLCENCHLSIRHAARHCSGP